MASEKLQKFLTSRKANALGLGAFFLAIAGLIVAARVNDRQNLKNDIKTLGTVPTHFLTSREDGRALGLSKTFMKASIQDAMSIAERNSTMLTYFLDEEDECKQNHTEYAKKGRLYSPLIEGWLVAQNNPNCAIPVYSGSEEGSFVYYDGDETHNLNELIAE